MNGCDLIAQERGRQLLQEGWTFAHDDSHRDGEMAMAAACYAVGEERTHVSRQLNSSRGVDGNCYQYDYSRAGPGEIPWPWEEEWYKPEGGRIRELTKAGALIAAEIDRLQRAGGREEEVKK
ncbi:MAG: hypothetical protein GY851_00505 [bacterium]|nr:hypothetical protein [bacterium]